MRLDSQGLKELQILKYYRLVRKWACKTYGLTDAELELLIYLDHKNRFTRQEFIDGTYTDKVFNKSIDDMIKDPER